jgi:hypothetical protein
LEEGVTETARKTHGSLHHLHCPGNVDGGTGARATKLERCLSFQIAAYRRQDPAIRLTFGQLDPYAHAVGQWGSDHAAKDCSWYQASIQSELREPGPPAFELVGLLHGVPQLLGRTRERILTLVGDRRPARHLVNARGSGQRSASLIPGASSLEHLDGNLTAAELVLDSGGLDALG